MFINRVEKIKRKLQKYILKLIDRKKKKLKNDNNKFIYFFYKNSLNDLNDIKDSNSEYKSKRRQKKSFSSIKEQEFEINFRKKNVEEIKIYYILIKHSISVQTLIKLDSHSTL